jgi:hypothetical protein
LTFTHAPAVAAVAFGAYVSAGFARDIYFALKSKQWPTAVGKVIDSEIVVTPAVRGSYTSPLVGYEYEVRGVRYKSNRIDYSGRGSSLGLWSRPARNYLQRHREGEPVTVRYDQNEPKRAVLETGPTFGNFSGCLLASLSSASGSSRFLRANDTLLQTSARFKESLMCGPTLESLAAELRR